MIELAQPNGHGPALPEQFQNAVRYSVSACHLSMTPSSSSFAILGLRDIEGLDLAKNVLQVHAIDAESEVLHSPAVAASQGVEVLCRAGAVTG